MAKIFQQEMFEATYPSHLEKLKVGDGIVVPPICTTFKNNSDKELQRLSKLRTKCYNKRSHGIFYTSSESNEHGRKSVSSKRRQFWRIQESAQKGV